MQKLQLLIATAAAALFPVSAQSATIITYSGYGYGYGYSYDYADNKWTSYSGIGGFTLTFDTDNYCYYYEVRCSVNGNKIIAELSSYHTQYNLELNFYGPLSDFPLSNAGFSSGTLRVDYGGPAYSYYSEIKLTSFQVTVEEGPSRFADLSALGPTTVAAVPEPASWAMLILGVGAMGTRFRRRSTIERKALAA